MTTKERIIEEALTLFSTNGFKGTSVKSIADSVGIKDASLYKHFKSKQEILDIIVESMKQRIAQIADELGLPVDNNIQKAIDVYASFNENKLVEISKKIFLFYLKDSLVSRFWKMGNIEQFQNSIVYEVYRKLFLEDSIRYQTELFKGLIKEKIFIEADPEVVAMAFYAPIFFLLSKYSNSQDKEEEALKSLEKQVREFYRIYKY